MDRLELTLALFVFFGSVCEDAPPSSMEFTVLDDFKEPSAWLQGDPKISLEQQRFRGYYQQGFSEGGKAVAVVHDPR